MIFPSLRQRRAVKASLLKGEGEENRCTSCYWIKYSSLPPKSATCPKLRYSKNPIHRGFSRVGRTPNTIPSQTCSWERVNKHTRRHSRRFHGEITSPMCDKTDEGMHRLHLPRPACAEYNLIWRQTSLPGI